MSTPQLNGDCNPRDASSTEYFSTLSIYQLLHFRGYVIRVQKAPYSIFGRLVYLNAKNDPRIEPNPSFSSTTVESSVIHAYRQLVPLNSSRNPPLVLTGTNESLQSSSSSVTSKQFLQQLDIHSKLGSVLLNETFHHRVSSNGIALTSAWSVVDNGNTSRPSRWQLNLSTGILSQVSVSLFCTFCKLTLSAFTHQ